jgi:hypothetical protein
VLRSNSGHGCQAHTIRGLLSIAKKKGVNIEVIERADDSRAYHLVQ